MMRHKKLVRAYYYRGEPEFENMRMLLRRVEPVPVPVQLPPKIIEISNDTQSNDNLADIHVGSTVVLFDTSEEVVSPFTNNHHATARKLFDELNSPPRGPLPALGGIGDQPRFPTRMRNLVPMPSTTPSTSQQALPGSQASHASQASSSTIKWFWFSENCDN
ncbi:hypothetical protein ACS0TY_024458 [Phlomoides rotata]